jgi:hypothetical protein
MLFGLAQLAAAYFFKFVHGNEYKFILLSSFPFAMITARLLDKFAVSVEGNTNDEMVEQKSTNWYRLGTPIVMILFICASINILAVSAYFQKMGLHWVDIMTVEEHAIRIDGSDAVYAWIRDTTPHNTLVITNPDVNVSFFASVATNRSVLIAEPVSEFSQDMPNFDLYYEYATTVTAGHPATPEWATAWNALLELTEGHPIALIISNDSVANDEGALAAYHLQLYFTGERTRVYMLED